MYRSMGLKLLKVQYMYSCLMFVLLNMPDLLECHNLKQLRSSNKLGGQLSKWYLKWLSVTNRRLQDGVEDRKADVNIQADEPGCRDDLCIEDDLDPDYFDERVSVEVSTPDARDIACPQGFEPIVRDGVIYCDVVRETTTYKSSLRQCKENEERVGTECRSITKIRETLGTSHGEDDNKGCNQQQIGVPGEYGIVCVEKQIQDTSLRPSVNLHTKITTLELKRHQVDKNQFDESIKLPTDKLSTSVESEKHTNSQMTTDSRPHDVTTNLFAKSDSLDSFHVSSTNYSIDKITYQSPIMTSLSSVLTCPDGQEVIVTENGPSCQKILKQITVFKSGNMKCSDNGCSSIQTSKQEQTRTERFKENAYSRTATVGLTSQRRSDNDPIPHESSNKPSMRPEVSLPPYHSLSFTKFGSGNENRINSKKGHHPHSKLLSKLVVDQKFAPCEDGKVLAGTREGYKCIDPVFPGDVCPTGRVPHLSSTGLQCVPCPFGQYTQMIDGSIKCVVIQSLPPITDPSIKPCTEGMVMFETSSGRICKHIPFTTQPVKHLCPDGQTSILLDNKIQCKDKDNLCPVGRVPITIETGEIICGFDIVESVEKSREEKLSNICPPGLETVHLTSGEIACRYITESITLPIPRTATWCGQQEVLTQSSQGFLCQSIGNIPQKALPDCSDDLILVRFGQYFDCITENEAKLNCKGNEQLMRGENGFVCKKTWDDILQGPCNSNEVLYTDFNGHISCISMLEAEEQCGRGFMALKYGDGFICREKALQVSCPDGFKFQLVKGLPSCVSASEPGCVEVDGNLSELCGTDLQAQELPGLDSDFIFESENTCIEGQIATVIDGKQICIDEGNIELTEQQPCESDGVRPCDLDLAILLQGCNPECANGGTCTDGRCLCPEGITGVACSEDIDECTSLEDTNCDYHCENYFGGYQCTCPHGMILGTNGYTCEDPGCIPDCLNGGQCVRGTCKCRQGFEGDYCQTDKDECSLYGDKLCQHYCRNTYGGYECICPPGSRLNQDKRTCTNTTCLPECRNGGSCENHRCYCPPGFYGFVCQLDINECYRNPCGHDCINTWGSFICICREGYSLGHDGYSCKQDN